MPVSEQGAVAPIVVDVAKAIQQMEDNPEFVTKLHELAFGPLAAQQLKVRDEIIDELVEALEAMREEFRGYDLPYGSKAYQLSGAALAKARGEV